APSTAEMVPVEPGVLAVTGVRARPSPMAGGSGGVYLTVLNGLDQPLQLTGIDGVVAGSLELHESVNDQGVIRMEPHPEGFPIPARSTLELKPGGKHIMLIDLAAPLAVGDVFTLTLNFDKADPLTIDVPVAEDGAMTDMHMPMPAHADLAPDGPTLADQQSDGIHGWLTSTPAEPTRGEATIDAYLVADDGQPIEGATVTLDIDMTNMSHGQYLVPAEAAGGGHYAGNVHFSMPGPWRIIANIERPGQEVIKLRFDFMVKRG
ncbi:MAG TPA: copper chaperone PCu(A)C, partial [Caldilinea sp.]|nr:copper chaperone PCu(A)C [Caldilinea sp.]